MKSFMRRSTLIALLSLSLTACEFMQPTRDMPGYRDIDETTLEYLLSPMQGAAIEAAMEW